MSHLKRLKKPFLFIIFLGACLFLIFNLPVTSKQGVNYVVKSVKIPLYIKIIEFLDRDYHYKELTQRISQGASSDEAKVMALFEWTYQNIKTDIPQGWPLIDDHVWYIVIRGYGASDQLSDVFTTLCNYADVDAFFTWVFSANRTKRIPLSFVKIDERWRIFDPYRGSYFRNKNGEIADINEIKSSSSWSIESLDGKLHADYAEYLGNLPSVKDVGLTRANIQSPLNRLRYEISRRFE